MRNATQEEHKKASDNAKMNLDISVEFWKNVLWSDVSFLDSQISVWCKKGKTYEQKDIISMVKHGGGPVLLWGCFLLQEVEVLTV